VTWEAREPSVSIGVDEVSFWHLVAGVLVADRRAPSKSSQRFPSLLEEFDFWPGAMVKIEGQPMRGRISSETWDTVVRREERGQSEGTRGKVSQITRGRALWEEVLGCCGLKEELSTSNRGGLERLRERTKSTL